MVGDNARPMAQFAVTCGALASPCLWLAQVLKAWAPLISCPSVPGEHPAFGHQLLCRSCGGAESAASRLVRGDLQYKGLCLGKATSLSFWRVYFLFLTDAGGAPGTVVSPALQQSQPLSASGALCFARAEGWPVQTHSGFCFPRGGRFTDAQYPSLQPEFCRA